MGICQLLFGDASLKHVIIHLKMKEAGKKHSVNVSVLSHVMNANGTYAAVNVCSLSRRNTHLSETGTHQLSPS